MLRSQLGVSKQRGCPGQIPEGALERPQREEQGGEGRRSWRRKVAVWGSRESFAAQRALREVHSGGEGLASSLVTP